MRKSLLPLENAFTLLLIGRAREGESNQISQGRGKNIDLPGGQINDTLALFCSSQLLSRLGVRPLAF